MLLLPYSLLGLSEAAEEDEEEGEEEDELDTVKGSLRGLESITDPTAEATTERERTSYHQQDK